MTYVSLLPTTAEVKATKDRFGYSVQDAATFVLQEKLGLALESATTVADLIPVIAALVAKAHVDPKK